MNRSDIAHLIERCRAGDALAIEALVRAYQHAVYRLAFSILDDPAEADEAAQDAFLTSLRALDSFRGDSAFTTWLYMITLNVCRRRLRQRRAWSRVLNALRTAFQLGGHSSTDPEVATIQHEADARLWAAVNGLGEKHRLPVILRYYHGLSIAEIARILKLNEGTVHSRLNTARERLRAALQGDPDFTWEREYEVEAT